MFRVIITILIALFILFCLFWSALFFGILCLPYIWNGTSLQQYWYNYRKKLNVHPLGLKNKPGKKAPKHHSILDVDKYKNMNNYTKSLGRSAKTSIKRCEKIFEKNSIVFIVKNENWKFTLSHMKVIYSHQARNEENILKLMLKTVIRSFAVNFTIGCLLEYYYVNTENGEKELIAFQQPIIKGNTFRAMWFYQKTKYCKSSIWFHALKYAVNRVTNDNTLRYIDLGPSYNDQVRDLKTKFGFEHIGNWRDICDYSGDFRSLLD